VPRYPTAVRRRPLAASFILLAAAAPTAVADDLGDALRATRPTLDLRLRHESVDDDAFESHARASTVRARLGARTGSWHGWSAFAEIERVRGVGGERYNDTANGRTTYPVVADPDATELNQAWFGYTDQARRSATLGRQRLVLDNQRHFGDVGFRQNQQTFDAVTTSWPVGSGTLRYAYLDSVQRVFGDDHPNPLAAEQDLDAHLVNASWPIGRTQLVGYAYLVDNQDLPATSARTLGVRWTGQHPLTSPLSLGWTAELARQDDWRDGSAAIDAGYVLGELSFGNERQRGRIGYERLGGDGRYGFSTPFATLHAFNGWADRFLTTPADGLVDVWVGAGGKLGRGDYAVVYHRFEADRGGADYGHEWDASYRIAFGTHLELEVKAARYAAESFASDVTKLWAACTVRY
jgi:hypothetical protein